MYFIDKRIGIICQQLKGLIDKKKYDVCNVKYKKGSFITSEEVKKMNKIG